jgi:FkbM family methyltransferase
LLFLNTVWLEFKYIFYPEKTLFSQPENFKMNFGKTIRKFLYKTLSFERYLYILSRLYFFSYRLGIFKKNPTFLYPVFLRKIINKGNVVIDIGANLGYYSCLFARWVGKTGKVYAVEPVEPVRNVLKKNTKKYSWVEIFPFALGNENKKINLGNDTLKSRGFVASGSHYVIDFANNPDAVEKPEIMFQAEMRKGSELFAELTQLDFIKCDVEGYEYVIIPEIQDLIMKFHPSVLIETGSANRQKIISFMTNLQYDAFVLKHKKLRPLHPEDTTDILFIYCNSLIKNNHDIFTSLI